jgi:hypothetical protein
METQHSLPSIKEGADMGPYEPFCNIMAFCAEEMVSRQYPTTMYDHTHFQRIRSYPPYLEADSSIRNLMLRRTVMTQLTWW